MIGFFPKKLFVCVIMNEDALQIGLCDFALNYDVFLGFYNAVSISSLIWSLMNLLIHIPVLLYKVYKCLLFQREKYVCFFSRCKLFNSVLYGQFIFILKTPQISLSQFGVVSGMNNIYIYIYIYIYINVLL